jgi:hypothetical protein
VLPRQWDGRRLLRFLTGLAMLALAFTVHVTPPAPALSAAPPVAAASSVSPAAPEAVSVEPVAALPALPAQAPAVVGAAVLLLFLVGRLLSVRAERAPPLA